MTLRTWLFDVSPSGTTLNTGNIKAVDGTAASTVSAGTGAIQSSSAFSQAGGLSALITAPATSSTIARLPFVAANLKGAVSLYRYTPAAAGSNVGFLNVRHAGGTLFRVVLTATGAVQLQDSTGSTLGTSGVSVTEGQWNRFEVVFSVDTATTGSATARVFAGDSTTAYASVTVSGVNLGTAAAAAIDLGTPVTNSTTALTQYFDSVQMSDGATAELGPYVVANNVPTVTVTGNQNVAAGATATATATAADSDGTIASYAWSVVTASSSATPTLTGASTATVSFTAPAEGNLVTLKCVVTDDRGATANATTEVRVPSSAASLRPLPFDGTGAGTWVKAGGAATDGAALADESNTTYIESGTASATEQRRRVRLAPSSARTGVTLSETLSLDVAGTVVVKVRLLEGNTLRQEWTQAVTATPTAYTFSLTDPTAITDWGNLYVEFSVTG